MDRTWTGPEMDMTWTWTGQVITDRNIINKTQANIGA